MKKRKVNALLAIVLSLTMLVGVTGCGKEQQLEAEINPDTPATEVQFPLKELQNFPLLQVHRLHQHRSQMNE